jgi:hypothetical protein
MLFFRNAERLWKTPGWIQTYNDIVIEFFSWRLFLRVSRIHPHRTKKVDSLDVGRLNLYESIMAQSQL